MWRAAVAGDAASPRDDLTLQLASSHAARASVEAAQLAFASAGTEALHEDRPLQRFHRDLGAAQQHGMIAFHSYQRIGKALLDDA